MALYNEYRPKEFKDIVGNKEVVESLEKLLNNKSMPHVFMFTGNSGCAKTTTARIMANKLTDKQTAIIEINCSNKAGADQADTIISELNNRAIGSKNKVYILDEIHMSSKHFQNALLKPFEDTPDHVYFFLCTTDPQKIIKTIKSRATTYNFSPPPTRDMIKLLRNISKQEDKEISTEVIRDILKSTSNHPRASLNILEKIMEIEGEENQKKAIENTNGNESKVNELCIALLSGKPWKDIRVLVKGLEGDAESNRRAILGYLNSGLMNGWTDRYKKNVFALMECFEYNFYDTGNVGLSMACYRGSAV